jgi:hypothetical protein
MRDVLVCLQSGAGVVRTEHGLVVTDDVSVGGGIGRRADDPFDPAMTGVSESQSVVGGRLPPGAVSAEAVDDRGVRVEAVLADGVRSPSATSRTLRLT